MNKKEAKTPEIVNEQHLIIDAYYNNGFNGMEAVKEIRSHLDNKSASVIWQSIKNNKKNAQYIEEKQARLQSLTDIKNENILRELINWAYVDVTQVIGLTPEEVKELPSDVRRCIQDYKVKESYDKHGNHTGTTIEVKFQDKAKAFEMINKHVGFYAQDNDQKASKVNILQVLEKADSGALNSLLKAMEETKRINSNARPKLQKSL